MRRVCAAAFAIFLVAWPARAASDAALARPNAEWAEQWQKKDLDAVLALYTPDAVFLDADGSRVEGQAALRKFFATILKGYSARPTVHSVSNAASGDLAYDEGDYTEIVTPVANPSGAFRTHGTYLVILRRVAGRWLIAEQVWTGSTPVPMKK